MKRTIAITGVLTALFFSIAASDCSNGIDFSGQDTDGDTDGIETDLTDPEAVLQAHERAWSERDYAAYEALLDDLFEFYPLAEDVQDFPWLGGADSWGRTVELEMVTNMFDPNYSQGEGAVDLIEMDLTKQQSQTHDDGRVEMTTVAVGRVMWTSVDGASFDTRLKFELVPRDGFLRIREIKEMPRNAARPAPESVESASLGNIKTLYW